MYAYPHSFQGILGYLTMHTYPYPLQGSYNAGLPLSILGHLTIHTYVYPLQGSYNAGLLL